MVLQTVLGLNNLKTLYVSGEESSRQLKLRADRIAHENPECFILSETNLEQIFVQARNVQPDLLIIESIQTIYTEIVESSPGSVSQVRECSAAILKYAKESGVPVLLIGHINKEGSIAGPKVLEHIVDTVLQFEGRPALYVPYSPEYQKPFRQHGGTGVSMRCARTVCVKSATRPSCC